MYEYSKCRIVLVPMEGMQFTLESKENEFAPLAVKTRLRTRSLKKVYF